MTFKNEDKIIDELKMYIAVQANPPKRSRKMLCFPIIEQLKSGIDTLVIKISFFKYDRQIHRWVIETCNKLVEKLLRVVIIQFARSFDIPIVSESFKVRLEK